MRIATNLDLPISAYIMQKYVVGPATLKTMMHILLDELDKGAREVYLDAMEARVRFQTDVTAEHTETIKDYRSWHQYVIVDQHVDVEELDFHGCLSQSDVYFSLLKPLCSHGYMCIVMLSHVKCKSSVNSGCNSHRVDEKS